MKRFIDIGANLTDPQFRGIYRGKRKHADDFNAMIQRAESVGCEKMLVTGSNLEESEAAIKLATAFPGKLYATAGVHPCHAEDIPSEEPKRAEYFAQLEKVASAGAAAGTVKAFGEIGLDYDRLHYAGKPAQQRAFEEQLEIATRVQLPLFLHSRNCADDFAATLARYLHRLPKGGVVHSFTGTVAEMKSLLDLGLYIGINGCSLKTEENLEVVKHLPLNRLLLETDGPWCEIRPTHASHKYTTALPFEAKKPEKLVEGALVRGRCEPCQITQVAQVVAAIKETPVDEVAATAWDNSVRLFGMD